MKSNRVWKYTAALFICMLISAANAWGAVLYSETWETNHRTSGSNNYSADPKVYGAWTMNYSDAILNSNIQGSYCVACRVAGESTNSPQLVSSELTQSTDNITNVSWRVRGVGSVYLTTSYSTDGETWIEGKSKTACPGTNTTASWGFDLDVTGTLFLKFVLSVESSTNNDRTIYIDSIFVTGVSESGENYIITYNANGGSGSLTDTNSPYDENSIVTVLDNSFSAPGCGCSFVEWNTKADGTGTSFSPSESFRITQDTVLYAQWQVTNYGGDVFERISSVGDLADGDEIIFVNQAETYACGVQQNTNNRTPVAISTSNHSYTFNRRDLVQVFTVRINDSGKHGFHTGCGYIYSASSTSNNLRTNSNDISVNPTETSAWTLGVSDNIFSITNATNVSYYLAFNGTSLFSQYASGQSKPYIYKKVSSANYTVTWKVNGEDYTVGTPTTETTTATGITTLPTPPADNSLGCANIFMGWSESDITGTGHNAPSDLFSTLDGAPTINENKTFHAVFTTGEAASVTSTFTSKAWADGNNLWTSGQDGTQLISGQGIQVSTSTSGANATTNSSYYKVTSVVVTYSTNASTGAGSITITVGGTSTTARGSVTTSGGTTDRTITYTPTLPATSLTGVVNITVTCTTNSIYIKSVQINYNTPTNYMTHCTYTFTDEGDDHNWSTADNWSIGSVPTINDRATITKPVIVDITNAKAKDIVLDQSGDNTGTLTINANKGLEVAETIKVFDGSVFVATGETDLILKSSADGNASLVFENHGNAASVEMYSKASIVGDTWNWQYVGTPFAGSIPLYNYYGSWMYKWNNGNWDVVKGGDELTPFVGYCLTQESATTHVMDGTLVSTTNDIEVTMPAETDMVLANSWTAPIYVGGFTAETFTSAPATIYLFNTGMAEDGASQYVSGEEAGTYVTIPVKAAEYTGTEFIAPMQGFFVTTNGDKGSAGTITLKYDELVRPADSRSVVAGSMRAPKRTQEDVRPAVLKISANGLEYKDRVTILEREDFSEGFDNGWDGEKLSFGVASPSVYVINADGNYDAVSAIPDLEGTVVGFRAGEDTHYTMTFDYEGEDNWYLNDLLEKESTLIANENTYSFDASNEGDEVRFVISKSPISKTTTDIDDVGGGSTVRKLIIHDKLFIIRGGRIYSADGSLVK